MRSNNILQKLIFLFLIYFIFFILNFNYLQINSSFIGTGDSSLYVWLTWQNIKNFSLGNINYDLPFYYPYHNTLAFSDNYFFPSLISTIIFNFGCSFFLSYNFPLLLAYFLNLLTIYILTEKISKNTIASLLIAIALLFSPYIISQTQHPQLQFLFPSILAIYFSLKYLDHFKFHDAFMIGFCILISFLCSFYLFYITLLVIVVIFIYSLFTKKPKYLISFSSRLFLVNLVNITLLIYFALPYLKAANQFGTRKINDVSLTTNLLSFFSMPEINQLWGNLTSNLTNHETHFCLGLIVLFLTLCSFLKLEDLKLKFYRKLFIILSIIFYIISFGPIFKTGIFVAVDPYTLLYTYIPGFSAIRAAGRFAIFSYLSLFILAGIGFTNLEKFLKSNLSKLITGFIFISLILLEYHCDRIPMFSTEQPMSGEIISQLNKYPEGAIIALPYPRFTSNEAQYSNLQTKYMHLLREQSHPLVNGYSGLTPPFHIKLYYDLRKFPHERNFTKIRQIEGLKYLLYFSKYDDNFDVSKFQSSIDIYSNHIHLLYEEEGIYLFEIL